jgi:hypothetical protein
MQALAKQISLMVKEQGLLSLYKGVDLIVVLYIIYEL